MYCRSETVQPAQLSNDNSSLSAGSTFQIKVFSSLEIGGYTLKKLKEWSKNAFFQPHGPGTHSVIVTPYLFYSAVCHSAAPKPRSLPLQSWGISQWENGEMKSLFFADMACQGHEPSLTAPKAARPSYPRAAAAARFTGVSMSFHRLTPDIEKYFPVYTMRAGHCVFPFLISIGTKARSPFLPASPTPAAAGVSSMHPAVPTNPGDGMTYGSLYDWTEGVAHSHLHIG